MIIRTHPDDEPELDPNYEWDEIWTMAEPGPRYVRGMCKHLTTVTVTDLIFGYRLTELCTNCDMVVASYV